MTWFTFHDSVIVDNTPIETRKRNNEMNDLTEIEINTALNWMENGTLKVVSEGEENTYYVDEFDAYYFCKNLL